ncbi:small-conductance mechanosensitive channel [Streptomyces albogriseolus]
MNTTAKAAQQIARLVEAEEVLTAARRAEAKATKTAERATARAKAARANVAPARAELRKAERTGKGLAAATRRLAARTAKAADLEQTAREARHTARQAARAAATAARRLDRLALRAATTATRMVGEVAARLGERVAPAAPEQDKTLPVEELPAVEEIEAHAERFKALDADAKATAKLAEAEKKWLRRLPVGVYGRVTITRTNGGTVLDGDQVAVAYLDAGLGVPPRKGRKDTFKVALAAPAVETAEDVALVLTA